MDVNEEMISIFYKHNDIEYEVTDSEKVHLKLQTDEAYYAQYFANISGCDVAESHVDDMNCIDDDSDNDSKALWDHKSIKIVLTKYMERLSQFRNLQIKKNRLWKEIEIEMKALGYLKINAQSIDRKIRNMESTYKRIKNNKNKTGRGHEDLTFYIEMDEIFSTDKSMNFEEGISSMNSGQDTADEAIDFSKRRLSSPTLQYFKYFQYFSDIRNYKFFSNYNHSVSSYYDTFSDSDLEGNVEGPLTSRDNMLDEHSCSTSNDETRSQNTFTKDSSKKRSLNRKKLCSQRDEAMELEARKIRILESIEKKQESKNMIVEQLERLAVALETKNELAKRKNDLLDKNNELLYKLLQSKDDTSK